MSESADDFSVVDNIYENDIEECEDIQLEEEQNDYHFGIEENVETGAFDGLVVEDFIHDEINYIKEVDADYEEEQVQEEKHEQNYKTEEESEMKVNVDAKEKEIYNEENSLDNKLDNEIDNKVDNTDDSVPQEKAEDNIDGLNENSTNRKDDTIENVEKKQVQTNNTTAVKNEKNQSTYIKNAEQNYSFNMFNPRNINLTENNSNTYGNKNMLFPSLSPTNIPIPGKEKENIGMLHMDPEKYGYKYSNGLNPAEGYLFVYPHVSNNNIPPKIRKKKLRCC